MAETSTKPYMIRALHEWCCDNGFTPQIVVVVDHRTIVPRQFVRSGQIVLNVSPLATNRLELGNDFIAFQARFGGVAHEISIPVDNVLAIYARENEHGMAFEVTPVAGLAEDDAEGGPALVVSPEPARPAASPGDRSRPQLKALPSGRTRGEGRESPSREGHRAERRPSDGVRHEGPRSVPDAPRAVPALPESSVPEHPAESSARSRSPAGGADSSDLQQSLLPPLTPSERDAELAEGGPQAGSSGVSILPVPRRDRTAGRRRRSGREAGAEVIALHGSVEGGTAGKPEAPLTTDAQPVGEPPAVNEAPAANPPPAANEAPPAIRSKSPEPAPPGSDGVLPGMSDSTAPAGTHLQPEPDPDGRPPRGGRRARLTRVK